jgi:nitronate monooxygenase
VAHQFRFVKLLDTQVFAPRPNYAILEDIVHKHPVIIQGGMGAGISNWRLAQAVSRLGQLGVVSGTALDQILARRLQDGDPGGHMRRGLDRFPFPKMAERIWQKYYIPAASQKTSPTRACRSIPLKVRASCSSCALSPTLSR